MGRFRALVALVSCGGICRGAVRREVRGGMDTVVRVMFEVWYMGYYCDWTGKGKV